MTSSMLYAVCTQCAFLRAYSRRARGVRPPECCPVCSAEVEVYNKAGRFQPTYVGRVSLDLHRAPMLERGAGNPAVPPTR
jgi:hypothetical protein